VAIQVLGAAIDTTLLQVSGVVDGAVGLSEPPVITGENFEAVTTQLGNAQFILGSISGLKDTTGGNQLACRSSTRRLALAYGRYAKDNKRVRVLIIIDGDTRTGG
jgi:hypothetical protein